MENNPVRTDVLEAVTGSIELALDPGGSKVSEPTWL
jgi:hypothetical protein